MTARPCDVEKAEGGLKAFEGEAGATSVVTASPKSSQGSTLTGHFSTSSDDNKQAGCCRKDSIWSRYTGSLRSLLGLRRSSSSDKSNNENDSSDDDDDDDEEDGDNSIVRKIHDQPIGYPRMATFLDSDESFMVYRRFGYLQSRLLLDRQDELRGLELELDIMEGQERKESPGILRSRRDSTRAKKELLDRIEARLNAYYRLLTNASTMTALNKPTSGERSSVAAWLWNVKPVRSAEVNFLRCKEDLVTLRPGREHAWLDSGVEKMLKWLRWAPIRKAFQSKDTRAKSNGKDGTVLYTRSRIENFVVSIITLMILALLIIPIWVLYDLSEPTKGDPNRRSFECIGVLLVSTLAFSACISLFTRAQRHEILAASAAYCAVLVVFIGNIGHV